MPRSRPSTARLFRAKSGFRNILTTVIGIKQIRPTTRRRLTEIERKNIEKLTEEKNKSRNTAISIGDMENFQNALLTEDKLAGLTMLDLRILREEFYARHGKKFDEPGIRDYFQLARLVQTGQGPKVDQAQQDRAAKRRPAGGI